MKSQLSGYVAQRRHRANNGRRCRVANDSVDIQVINRMPHVTGRSARRGPLWPVHRSADSASGPDLTLLCHERWIDSRVGVTNTRAPKAGTPL